MVILSPHSVTFAGLDLGPVDALVIDRAAARLAEEWSDLGPHRAFVDVPEQRVDLRLTQRLIAPAALPELPPVGTRAALRFAIASPTGPRPGRAFTVQCVLTGARHDLPSGAQPAARASRTLTFAAVSDGAADPIAPDPG